MYKGKFNDCVEPLWEYMSTEVTVHGVVCVCVCDIAYPTSFKSKLYSEIKQYLQDKETE
jgi:hypothetical protein